MFFIFITREFFSEQKIFTAANLSGTYQREPGTSPLAVQHLNNVLNMIAAFEISAIVICILVNVGIYF